MKQSKLKIAFRPPKPNQTKKTPNHGIPVIESEVQIYKQLYQYN